jgi:hypothetical protein
MRVGSCGYIPSSQAPEATISQGLVGQHLSICGKPLGMLDQGLRSLSQVDKRGERGRWVVKSPLPVQIVGRRSDGSRDWFFLDWWCLPFCLE